jgi:Domain of unknown function (DUF4129)
VDSLNARRLLPYIAGLIVLAFAFGSLPRASAGGSLLFRSYWLLYLIYLAPFLVLGAMVAIIVFFAFNWRDIAGAIGFKMAQNRKVRKRRSRYSFLITVVMWAIAVIVLIEKPGTIFNHIGTANDTVSNIQNDGTNSTGTVKLAGVFPIISSLVQNSWFDIAFLGLLVVGGVVLVQSVRVGMKETSEMSLQELQTRRIEGLQATQDAIKLMDSETSDPRSRIIGCFQRLVLGVSRLGVPVSPDQTARELEVAICKAFAIQGSATSELTQLFEEARYSVHEMTNPDASQARECLEAIAQELRIQLER